MEGQARPWYLEGMGSPGENPTRRRDLGITLIGIFKLVKGLLLIALGVAAATLMHRDIQATIGHWANVLWVGRENRMVERLLTKLSSIDNKKLEIAEIGTFAYAALFLTEGTGLLLRRRWAEYLTVIITASLIPFELGFTIRRFTLERVVVLLLNIAVVWYLVVKIRRDRRDA